MFLLPNPTSHPEKEAARGAQTSGQTPVEGHPPGKWPKGGSGLWPPWESWEMWEGIQG